MHADTYLPRRLVSLPWRAITPPPPWTFAKAATHRWRPAAARTLAPARPPAYLVRKGEAGLALLISLFSVRTTARMNTVVCGRMQAHVRTCCVQSRFL